MTETFNGTAQQTNTKFCKHCGGKIPHDAVVCTLCGRQVENLNNATSNTPNIIINNDNNNTNSNTNTNFNSNYNPAIQAHMKNKWVALLLCFFGGFFGLHKFYEGKILLGIAYLLTGGLLFIGVIIDFIALLSKPNPYYV